MAFATQEDIGNRALQHVGAKRIASFSDTSRNAAEVAFCYDKLRVAELRRAVWGFATRRAILRPVVPGVTTRFIPGLWSNVTSYTAGQVVRDANGIYWIAQYNNSGDTPGVPITGFPAPWQQYFGPVYADGWTANTTYYAGDVVYISSTFYINTVNSSVGQNPSGGNGWVAQPAVAGEPLFPLLSPAGPGITVNGRVRNIFPLPNGYLRLAAPDPKIASTSTLVTTGAIQYQDWAFEGGVLISNATDPIFPFRFVADVSDVTVMDPLYCEALGARIGYEVCETLTQSNVKLQAIGAAYQKFVRDARIVNQIETGATEPAEDEIQLTQGPQGVQEGPAGAQAQPA